MPINQISKGVYLVSAPDVKRYKDTAAGEYTSVFTKQRADQWELAQKQALMEYKDRDAKYQAEMELYKKRIATLEAAKADLLAAAESKNVDAMNAALKFTAELEQKSRSETARLKAEREEAATSTTYLMPGTTTTEAGGGGFGGGRGERPKSRVEEVIGGAMAEGGGDVAASTEAFKKQAIGAGLGSSLSKSESQLAGYQLTEALIDSKVRGGMNRDEATAAVARELSNSGNTDILVDYKTVSEQKAPTGDGAGGFRTETKRDVQSFLRNPGIPKEAPEVKRPSIGGYPAKGESTEGLAYVPTLMDPKKALESLDKMIAEAKSPELSDFDYITRAREIAAGRFGPTLGAQAPYVQRNVLDALLSASPKKRAELLDRYRKESGATAAPAAAAPTAAAPAAPAAPATTATPAPAATPAPVPPGRTLIINESTGEEYYIEPSTGEKVIIKPGTAAAPPAAPAPPVAAAPPAETTVTPQPQAPMIPQTQAPSVTVSQPPPSAIALPRKARNILDMQLDLESILGPEEARRLMAERNIAPVPEPPRLPDQKIGDVERNVPPMTVEAPPVAPPAGLETVSPLPRATLDDTVQPRFATKKAVIKDTNPRGYLVNRLMEADQLLAQSSRFDRLLNSELGKTIEQLWSINYRSGKDFKVTWKEIQNQYSLDPDLMKKAHAIALALDKSAMKKNKPPVVEEKE